MRKIKKGNQEHFVFAVDLEQWIADGWMVVDEPLDPRSLDLETQMKAMRSLMMTMGERMDSLSTPVIPTNYSQQIAELDAKVTALQSKVNSQPQVVDYSNQIADLNAKFNALQSSLTGYLQSTAIGTTVQGYSARLATLSDATANVQIASDRPLVTITANTTLATAHLGRFLAVDATTNITLTIPTNLGSGEIDVCQQNTGNFTVAAATGVTLITDGTRDPTSIARGAIANLKRVAANTWVFCGALRMKGVL